MTRYAMLCLLFIYGLVASMYGYSAAVTEAWYGFAGNGGGSSFIQRHPVKSALGLSATFSGILALIAFSLIFVWEMFSWTRRRWHSAKLIRNRIGSES